MPIQPFTCIMASNVTQCPRSRFLHSRIKLLKTYDQSIECTTVHNILSNNSKKRKRRYVVAVMRKEPEKERECVKEER